MEKHLTQNDPIWKNYDFFYFAGRELGGPLFVAVTGADSLITVALFFYIKILFKTMR